MEFSRFMNARQFARELENLKVFGGSHVSPSTLEMLEATKLLLPRLRIRYPDPVARRLWLLTHDYMPRQLKHLTEPDGPRWDAALALDAALHRWQNATAYGLSAHPLDDPEPRFLEFIERPSEEQFVPLLDLRVDISNDVEDELYADINFDNRYTTWQLLLAAEQADAGVHLKMNLEGEAVFERAYLSLKEGRLPDGARYSINLIPIHASRDFRKQEKSLDAMVWFTEERSRVLSDIIKEQDARRFRLNSEQASRYDEVTSNLALSASQRFGVGVDELVLFIQCFTKRWSDWKRNGRPLIAGAYEEFLEAAVILARRIGGLKFDQLRDRVGVVEGWHKPALDLIWPDWVEQEKDRAHMTLRANLARRGGSIPETDTRAFVEFLASEGLEAFFWRLNSFEGHTLRGNEFAIEGMQSDVQGMAVVVEHVAAKLGATAEQLYEKLKQLWRDVDVLRIIKRGDVAPLARQKRLADNWPELKAKIDALRQEPGGETAADLVMAHRIRGGVHMLLPEDDHFELEALFTGLMRTAFLTFVEVRGR